MNTIQRYARRVGFLRYCIVQHLRKVRQERAESYRRYEGSVMTLIGTMTVAWAGIERMLDEVIATHQQQYTGLSERHPRELSRKLAYLKTMQNDVWNYKWGTREFFRVVRIEAKRLGSERHDIIHGIMRRSSGKLTWQCHRVVYDGPNASAVSRDFSNDELVQVLKDMRALTNLMTPRIYLLTAMDKVSTPYGEIEQIRSELLQPFPPVQIP